ncbi:MAG: 2-iminoacetate synthase, partial [Acidimicrobiaceae bacterium]|nr:2-iminoacetate synthase [Acidimicrobiaceae bacterium]
MALGSVPLVLDSRPDTVPPGTAAADVVGTDISGLRRQAGAAGPSDVERVLGARVDNRAAALADFAVLLSPAAAGRLEDLAQLAHATTIRRFGPTVRLYAPLYLSNECV